jgi:hypothetical protein
MLASLTLMTFLMQAAPEQTGAVALVTRRSGATAPIAANILRDLRKALADAGVQSPLSNEELSQQLIGLGIKDPKSCEGKKPCVLELGRQLKVAYVVSVSVGQIAKDISISLETIRISDGARVSDATVIVAIKELGSVPAAVTPFARKTGELLAPPPVKVADAPKAEPQVATPVLTPEPPPTPPPSVVVAAEPRSRVPAVVVGGGALAAGVATAFFAVSGFGDMARLNRGDVPQSKAQALADSANTQLSIALACGVTTAVLGTLAGVLLGTSGSTERAPQ